MNKTIRTIRKAEPDLVVKSKPLTEDEKTKLSAIIAKSKQKMIKEGILNN